MTRSDTFDHDVAIVGGGLNGPALGIALAQAGLSVAVIDAAPRATRAGAGFDGRSYALALASCRLMQALGLWQRLEGDAQPILGIKVSDGRAGQGPGPLSLGFDHAEIEEGPMGHLVEDRHLRPALLDGLDDAGVTHLSATRVLDQTVDAMGAALTLEGGKALTARLIVGADGRRSGVAARAGIARTERDYHQTALVCAVRHTLPHNGIAHQFFMPGGPLAILPLTGNRSSIVWSEERVRAEALRDADDETFLAALRPAFGSFLGDIALAGARHAYPLGLSLAERVVDRRVALVGDAAHGVHPVAGQGLNAGLRDVAALTEELTRARQRGEDIGAASVLARYAGWRRFDTALLAMATDGFARLFSNDNPVLRGLRGLGLGMVDAAPPLRRAFIREAAGLSGDLPPLMRG